MEREALLRALKALPHFRLLDATSLDRLARHATSRSLSAGEAIFLEGEAALAFYALRSGGVKLFRLTASNREQVIQLLGPGSTFAETAVFSPSVHHFNASAIESPTELIVIPSEPIHEMIREDNRVATGMIASLSVRVQELVDRVDELAHASAEGRLARYVLKLPVTGPPARPTVDLRVARSDLAVGLSIPPEILSRVFKKWEESGLVASANRTLAILDPGRLNAIADGKGAAGWLVDPK